MKILIAGAGEVGLHLAKQLSLEEQHDIFLIDIDEKALDRADAITEVITINRSSTSIKTLIDADCANSDLVVSVTSNQSININTCIIAKKLGAKKTIARVSSAEYVSKGNQDLFKSVGIDHLIYPEELVSLEIEKLIQRSAATDVLEFENGELIVMGLKLGNKAPILNKTVLQIVQENPDFEFRIAAIYRGFKTIIPSANDRFLLNDQVFIITTRKGVSEFIRLSGKEETKLENVMILGGGKIGSKSAKLLEKTVNVKLIEANYEKSLELADYLDETLVIQGDGREIDLLAQEGLQDMDAFIAVTDNTETNIITALLAHHFGIEKTIAQVDNVDYIPLTQTIGLDSLINQKLIAANNITRFIRKSDVVAMASLIGIDAEVFEFNVSDGAPITKKQIKKIKFPSKAIMGGYVRNGIGNIIIGDTQLLPNDKVVVFALPGIIKEVERLF